MRYADQAYKIIGDKKDSESDTTLFGADVARPYMVIKSQCVQKAVEASSRCVWQGRL